MKIAEALIMRSNLQNEIGELRNRLGQNVKVQEGDEPAEDPIKIIETLESKTDELTELVIRINKTNHESDFNSTMKISDALAKRDGIKKKVENLEVAINNAAIYQDRYSRHEVKFIVAVDIEKLQKEKDLFSKKWRELDTKIQGLNWNTELL